MQTPENTTGHDFEDCSVPESKKRGFNSMFVIMMGFTFFSASMWVGLNLANGLSLGRFVGAVMAGNVILGVYTGLLAFIAARTGLSIHLLSRYSFGTYGSNIPSLILTVTQIGWFGVGVAMFSIPTTFWLESTTLLTGTWFTQGALVKPWGIADPGLHANLLWTITVVSGIVMTSSAYFGIKALHIISIIAVPSIAILGGWSAIQSMFFDKPDFILANNASLAETLRQSGATIKNGFDAMLQHQPVDAKTGASTAIGMVLAISMGIGSFVSGGSCTPDFTRFAKTTRIAVTTTVLAFFIGNSLMFFFGGAAAMVYNKNDISEVLKIQGLLLPAIVVLLLNIWTTNDNALYTSGLGLSNIVRLPKRYMVLLNGLVGTLAGLWLYDNFCGWLNILNTLIPPCGAIIITDFFLVNRLKYPTMKEKRFTPFSIAAAISWAVGSVVALAGFEYIKLGKIFTCGIPAINGMLATAIVYCLFSRFIKTKTITE